ncbi:DUF4880 domain-containing protein [Lampropedia puyangensis]|uniref:DUF4880 domain-containing protein n=1 Tax=Lampropedia puyangensis TaxID=1330072 RepID=A0A4S8F3I1_9BURK|nr:FecR domain-containing protein [Lampropedia puyangensis]THU01938.1 DUF4880 domain-containing protein [Lampropedia puyangensis]
MKPMRPASDASPAGDALGWSREVTEQATFWMVTLEGQTPESEDGQAFMRWHDAAPEHAAAWAQLQRFSARLRGDAPPQAASVLLRQVLHAQLQKDAVGVATARASAHSPKRRQAIKLLALAAFTSASSWQMLRRNGWWDQWSADYRTATGQQQTVVLVDGSQVVLNTQTVLNVRFSAQQRVLQLKAGEILVTTAQQLRSEQAHDPRPFLVQVPQGQLQALGTRFTVRVDGDHTHLGVLDGAVQAPNGPVGDMQVVRAGYQLRLDARQAYAQELYRETDAAWARGSLIAHDMPLPLFLRKLARYRVGRLACDASAAHLRVSGIFAVADTDKVLQSLQRNLPVQVLRRTNYWVTVAAR